MNKTPQQIEKDLYLDWLNNWLTVEQMAESLGMEENRLLEIIDRGKLRNLPRNEFDLALIELIKKRFGVGQGDAQGILEAHDWEVLTSFQRGHTPKECLHRFGTDE